MAEVVSIIGDGQMGLVMADAVAAAGLSVRLWGRDPERVESLAESRRSPRRLAEFLGECVEEPDTPLGIQVGLAQLSPAMKEYTLIGASYGRGEQPLGWLGFLGPARTDYARAITGVRYVAALIDRRLAEN